MENFEKLFNFKDEEKSISIFDDMEREYSQKVFGRNILEDKKSFKQVINEMNQGDFELFSKLMHTKRITLEGQYVLFEQIAKYKLANKPVPKSLKEKTLNGALKNVVLPNVIRFLECNEFNGSLTFGDFINEGYLMLEKAWDKFLSVDDIYKIKKTISGESYYASFNTYASYWVKDAFQNLVAENCSEFGINNTAQKKIRSLFKSKILFMQKYGRVPSDEELADFSNFTKETVTNNRHFVDFDLDYLKNNEFNGNFLLNDLIQKEEDIRNENEINLKRRKTLLGYIKEILKDKLEYQCIYSVFFEGIKITNLNKVKKEFRSLYYAKQIYQSAITKLKLNAQKLSCVL